MAAGELNTTVVIVGAGPTGLSLAAQLIRYDIDFIILEKRAGASKFSKAIAVQARSLEILDEIGLADKAIASGRIITDLNVFEKGKRKAQIYLEGLGKGISEFHFALSLAQDETERLLLKYLETHSIQVKWNSRYSHHENSGVGVKVFYTDHEGEECCVNAGYIVGADGAGSRVREQLGLGFGGDTVPKLFYVADVQLRSWLISESKIYMFLIKQGFILFIPMLGKQNYRVVGILPNAGKKEEDIHFEELEPFIKENVAVPVDFTKINWFSTYKVHTRKAKTFIRKNGFIAGDAAHIHTPAGGQGMNTGIQDAYNLAWKIALFSKGQVNRKVLESYDYEREKNAVHLLRTTDRIFDFMAGTSWVWNFIRLKIFPLLASFISGRPRFNRFFFPLISQTAISYSGSYLTVKSRIEKVKAGVRMPYFVFKNGSSIFEYLDKPQFQLLFFGKEGKARFEKLQRTHVPISCLSFTEIPREIFKKNANFYVLLRPDNHISYLGKKLKVINAFLNSINPSEEKNK